MKFTHFVKSDPETPLLVQTVLAVEQSTENFLESEGGGFCLPVHKKIRELSPGDNIYVSDENGVKFSMRMLVQAILYALKRAWEEGIEPRLADIRHKAIETRKGGTDFFTEADTISEQIIRETLVNACGENALRVFGEEANRYLGNEASHIGIRIDPVDGTETMKFGESNWGIMVGIYHGTTANEHQIAGFIYMPEEQTLVYAISKVGIFITDLTLGETREIDRIVPQSDIDNLIIKIWKHSEIKQQHKKLAQIEKALLQKGARIRSSGSCAANCLEALLSGGKRAFMLDGDHNRVDYIPYGILQQLGFTFFHWKSNKADIDKLTGDEKIIGIPPGQAGLDILEIVKRYAKT